MKLYLSSYKLGDKKQILQDWIRTSKSKNIALIPNATDAFNSPPNIKAEKIKNLCELFEEIGYITTVIDLKHYFGKEDELKNALSGFRTFFATGGNTFVLRQAMKLSGFDNYLLSLKDDENYLYGGWSAGICVLAKNLRGLEFCDEPKANPYKCEPIWEGVGLLDYLPVPHYKSNHPESELMDKVVMYMSENNLPYKTMQDGDVIVIDT